MRRLILVRHSKTVASVPAGDHARHLSPRGLGEAVAAGLALKALAPPDLALVSDARRTRETFDRIVEAFGWEIAHRFEPRLYGATSDEILNVIVRTDPEVSTLLVVGHNPGIGDLARQLAREASAGDRRDLAAHFPTSAFAILELAAPDWSGAQDGGVLEHFVGSHGV